MDTGKYRVLILGGLAAGEVNGVPKKYASAHDRPSQARQYIAKFVEDCDTAILNLGTSAPTGVNGQEIGEPSAANHHDNFSALGPALVELGINAVNLATSDIANLAAGELLSTFERLDRLAVERFGAGRTLEEANAPLRLKLPPNAGGGEVHLHGSVFDEGGPTGPGAWCAPLQVAGVPPARTEIARADSFQIALPQWGEDVSRRSHKQLELAHRFLNKDYDLIIGTGSCLQGIHRKRERWVVYGTGDSSSTLAPHQGRDGASSEEPPYVLWTILEVDRRGNDRRLNLKLYPVYTAAPGCANRLAPVSLKDFERFVRVLGDRPIRPWRFNNPAMTPGADHLGNYLNLDLGEWPIEGAPTRLEPLTERGDPGDWPFRGPSPKIEDRVLALDKHLGAAVLALEAEDQGGEARWLAPNAGVIAAGEKRVLVHGYWAHESPIGTAIVADKVLTAELLENHGVFTPSTRVAVNADEAVRAARELGGPVVLKPRNGNKSRGVSTGLIDEQSIRHAYTFARKHGSEVIVQQHIEATEELRVMASSKQAVATIKRLLPHVIGDGSSTIQQLIEDKNIQRTLNPSLVKRSIPMDSQTCLELEKRGYSLESVPSLGEKVIVRGVAGLSVGADAFQAFEFTDKEVLNTAAAAVAAIPGLDWGGVDLIVEKGTGLPYVIEVNAAAGYGQALFPSYGEPRNVGAEAWALRLAATITPPRGVPETPRIHRTPGPVLEESSAPVPPESVAVGELIHKSLNRQNYSLQRRNQDVSELVSPGGRRTWLRSDGSTAADRSVVRLVLKRHEWVLALLDDCGVPRARARRVRSVEQLRRFTEGRVGQVTLLPSSAPWDGPSSVRLTDQEVLQQGALPGRMLVQARPRGRRIRILASDRESWVATVNVREKRIEDEHFEIASRLAVEAVRAIPELRWAAVDLVIRPSALREGSRTGVLVEGLTMAPRFSSEDLVLAGNLDEFCLDILKGVIETAT